MSKNQKTHKHFNLNNYPLMLNVIPKTQSWSISQVHQPLIEALNKTFENIPELYEQDGLLYEAIVHAHYFVGGSDWFITEYNKEENLAFGYVILNQDVEMSEFGYISIKELTTLNINNLEIDLHWKNITLKEALLKNNRGYFEQRLE